MNSEVGMLSLTGLITENSDLSDMKLNSVSFRDAMGLKSETHICKIDNLSTVYQLISGCSNEQLVEITASTLHSFEERYAAGNLLALKGDPRIDVFNPCMLNVQGAQVTLGLSLDSVEEVTSRFAQYGVIKNWIKKECPTYQLYIPTFSLGKYCVTNWEYLCFLNDTGYTETPSSWPFGVYPRHRANYPVYTVSFEAAQAYTEWLSNMTGRAFHLPTESQWEYAAAGTAGLEYPWGNEFHRGYCNSVESGIVDATPVGIFPQGTAPYGHMDMAGNVEEYTCTGYQPYENAEAVEDDLLSTLGVNYKIARGGSFTRYRDLCRTRRRHGRYGSELYIMGFRLAERISL